MANRGSFNYNDGDPIYALEIIYRSGETSWKIFPSIAGLKSGVSAIKRDIGRSSFSPQSYRVLTTDPVWEVYDLESHD